MVKILIADDEMLEREAIKFIINEHFPDTFKICEAVNGREAIRVAEEFEPDLIFFDIKMPGINGLEAAAHIKKILPECRVVILSAYHQFNFAKDAISLGADEYLTKPTPVEKVVASLQKVLDHIAQTRSQREHEAETAKKLQQIAQYVKEELLILIAMGEIEERIIKEYFAIFNLNYQAFKFGIISICSENFTREPNAEIEKAYVKKQVLDKVKTTLEGLGHDLLIGSIGHEIYILLLFNETIDEYESRVLDVKLFSEIKEQIAQELDIQVNIGIGNLCSRIAQIYTSFIQAKSALRYDMTPGSVISYGDIGKGDVKTAYPIHKEKLLYETITQGNTENSLKLLEEILDWLVIHTSELELFKQKIYGLLLVLVRETTITTSLSEFDIDTEELRKSVFSLDNSREIRYFAKQFLVTKIDEINHIKISRANALISRAMVYIEANYAKEMTLEDVAQIIQISPFYLSKSFKKELGENFIDVLTGVRIKKAREFLTDSMNTVKDVCYQVGYKDPNYFARVFKKVTGITPTEYKEKHMR